MKNSLPLALLWLGMLIAPQLRAQLPPEVTPYTVQLNQAPAPGYIFLSPHPVAPTYGLPPNLMVLDSAGQLIWYAPLTSSSTPPYTNTYPADFKPFGNDQFVFWADLGQRQWYLLDDQFGLVDSLACQGYASTNAHDITTADGHFFLLCDTTVIRDASQLTTANGSPGSSNCAVAYQIVQELDAQHQVISEWHSLDHLPLEDVSPEHWDNPSFMDQIHINSIRLEPDGLGLLSSRHLNEVTAYDRATGTVQWRMGGRGNQFQLQGDTTFFNAQHDARIAPNGHLYLFDNGSLGAHRIARYVEYDIDPGNQTARLVREIRHPDALPSAATGNAILLPNGHVIIDWGWMDPPENTVDITEYTADNEVALAIDFADPFLSYRVDKRTLAAPIERPKIACDPGQRTLRAPDGHASYWWSTGETTQEITVSIPGSYQVWVDRGIGYVSSVPFEIWDLERLCEGPVVDPPGFTWRTWPNPANDQFTVTLNDYRDRPGKISVWDLRGKVMLGEVEFEREMELDVMAWRSGWYVVQLEWEGEREWKKVWVR